ncbi:PREDICTED: cytochrome P450 9e2-like [Acromyrmex echinatior]|uniref:cytochrome P450 9e2-like n=1 Tax=Acromyrmex echinatior TaxID=103372 RepID=UPI00058107B9|nr:PREDICTED: cytochrome P450 9e2-like [Acromyrmex echinatior]
MQWMKGYRRGWGWENGIREQRGGIKGNKSEMLWKFQRKRKRSEAKRVESRLKDRIQHPVDEEQQSPGQLQQRDTSSQSASRGAQPLAVITDEEPSYWYAAALPTHRPSSGITIFTISGRPRVCYRPEECTYHRSESIRRHGIIHIPSIPILGVMAPIIFRRMSFANFTRKIYNLNRDAKYIGFYATTKPVLMLRDPEVIKAVIVKNFNSFTNNSIFVDVNDYVLSQNLFGLQNIKWRHVKNLLSPSFTSSKMKTMFTFMSKHAADFVELMSTLPADKSDINIKDIFDRYTNDVIALSNPSIQVKLRQEIDELLNESDGNVTYEAINKLKYLDAVIKEALRLFSQSSFTINKGMIIWIPLYAIHHDEKYYDNAEEFRPERFLNNNLDNNYRSSFYFPFGLGSRMCIDRRFGLLMIKVIPFHLLARCELKQCAKTSSKIKFNEKNLLMMPKDGFWLNIQHRNDKKQKGTKLSQKRLVEHLDNGCASTSDKILKLHKPTPENSQGLILTKNRFQCLADTVELHDDTSSLDSEELHANSDN